MTENTRWTEATYTAFFAKLEEQRDEGYRQFHERLLCTSLPVIGIRIPQLRQIAKEIAREDGEGFLAVCGRNTYEERLLFGLVTAELQAAFPQFVHYCDEYVENCVENWAHCDVFCSSLKKIAKKNEALLYEQAKRYLQAENPWVIRVGLIILMSYYLKAPYFDEVLLLTDGIHADFYYIQMAQAWLLATAWAKDSVRTRAYLHQNTLSDEVKTRFVQKARDSRRVSAADKALLTAWRKGETL